MGNSEVILNIFCLWWHFSEVIFPPEIDKFLPEWKKPWKKTALRNRFLPSGKNGRNCYSLKTCHINFNIERLQ